MGFFKDVRQLEKMGKEQRKNMNVGQRMADAQVQMAAAQQMMADQTKVTNAQASGVPATVTITGVREIEGGITPMCELDLTVIPQGLPPYPVTIRAHAAQVQAAFARPGLSLPAKVDPSDPTAVWLDYASQAR
jgi:hypothetical protein